MMFILSSIFSGLEFLSVNHISIYKNSELRVFKNMKLFAKIIDQSQVIDQITY